MKEIEDLLRTTMGFHAPTVGSSQVEKAVRERMAQNQLEFHHDYLKLVQRSPAEWLALVESVIIAETWFFRDREPFLALTKLVQMEWLPAHSTGKLRVLSVPCSTGEEPYSISIALLDAGVPAARLEIDALDISQKAVAAAQRANYSKNSFRGKEVAFRERHFKLNAKNWCLKPHARQPVRFEAANILDERWSAQPRAYDFIFCRNLLIYFDRPAQELVLRKLAGLLADGGTLFVGAAEMPIATRSGFVPVHLPLSFACRKGTPDAPAPKASGRSARARAREGKPQRAVAVLPTTILSPSPAQAGSAAIDLEQARVLKERAARLRPQI